LSGFLAGLILFLTVSTAFALGIVVAYGTINAILFLFAHQTAQRTQTPPVLVRSAHAGGD
jgi:hypothetical protein